MTRSSRVYLMRAKIECWLFENGINRIPATLDMGVRSGRVREWQSGRVREWQSARVREFGSSRVFPNQQIGWIS